MFVVDSKMATKTCEEGRRFKDMITVVGCPDRKRQEIQRQLSYRHMSYQSRGQYRTYSSLGWTKQKSDTRKSS